MPENAFAASVCRKIEESERFASFGRVSKIVGLIVEAHGVEGVSVGEMCRIERAGHPKGLMADVVGFNGPAVLLMPYGDLDGISPGASVEALGRTGDVAVGDALLGRVLNGLGQPIDGKGPLHTDTSRPIMSRPPDPLERSPIRRPLETGIRAIDGLITAGRGQRLGIFAGSGVGKSVLLGMIARNTKADVNVIALLGERGREVGEFIAHDLGEEGLARSVVVVATGDESAVVRARGAQLATSIAEYFRSEGKDVLLMLDSVTRVAMAWREIGLAVGEPPTTKGYPPSVFSKLPKLLERAGTSRVGSITGLYTVLVDGDDFNEPVADAARSVLDGHIVLSRKLAEASHYPAIDFLASKSRVRNFVIDAAHQRAADMLARIESKYRENEDLVTVGGYKEGNDREIDAAIAARGEIRSFLQQAQDDGSSFEDARARLLALDARLRTFLGEPR